MTAAERALLARLAKLRGRPVGEGVPAGVFRKPRGHAAAFRRLVENGYVRLFAIVVTRSWAGEVYELVEDRRRWRR